MITILFAYLTVEMTVSCSNQLTVFPVQYLLHSIFVLAEVVGFHDELAAWEFVAAAAVKNIEQYLAYLQHHKNGIKFYNIPFTFATSIASNCFCKQLKRLTSIC